MLTRSAILKISKFKAEIVTLIGAKAKLIKEKVMVYAIAMLPSGATDCKPTPVVEGCV